MSYLSNPTGETRPPEISGITGDETLTDASEPWQFRTSTTSPVTITLPTITDVTPHFMFQSGKGSTFQIEIIEPADGFQVDVLAPGERVLVYHDRDVWYSERLGAALGELYYPFGGNHSATNNRFTPHGHVGDTTIATDGTVDSDFIVPFDCRVRGFGLRASAATPSAEIRVIQTAITPVRYTMSAGLSGASYQEGATTQAHIVGKATYYNRLDDGNLYNLGTVDAVGLLSCQLSLKALGLASSFPHYVFGANLTVASRFAEVNGSNRDVQQATNGPLTEHTVHKAGNLVDLFWHVDVSGATMTVFINGGIVGTVVLGATEGRGAISGGPHALASGDRISVRYTSGTAPLNSIFSLGVDYDGKVLHFGGNLAAANRRWEVHGTADEVTSTTDDHRTELVIHEWLEIQIIAWRTTTASSTTQIRIFKNDVAIQTVTMNPSSGIAIITGVTRQCKPGDIIRLQSVGAANPGIGSATLYCR